MKGRKVNEQIPMDEFIQRIIGHHQKRGFHITKIYISPTAYEMLKKAAPEAIKDGEITKLYGYDVQVDKQLMPDPCVFIGLWPKQPGS